MKSPLESIRSRVSIPGSIMLLILVAATAHASPGSRTKADLSHLVVIGDSLSAGFQNGSLLDRQQMHGWAAVLAGQAGAELLLPLIAAPGIPNVLTLVDPGPPPVIVHEPGLSTGRTNPTTQVTNLAVPGAGVQDALTLRPDCDFGGDPTLVAVLVDFVLGLPGCFAHPALVMSQVEWAEVLNPTTILVWLGSNDTLGAAIAADASLVTPVADFERAYAEVLNRVAATGATLVVANIPDATAIPFLTSAEDLAQRIGLPLATLGPVLGIGPGDFVTPDAFGLIPAILAQPSTGPLPPSVVLDAGEVQIIRSATDQFNAFIAAQAAEKGAAVVDIHALLERAHDHGLLVDGQRLTTAFLGGLFSLDGIHPTNTGYAIIANQFINALDRTFAAAIPRASVERVMEEDPLVLSGVDHPADLERHVDRETTDSLRQLLRH
jgi:lysophospholipase L1-like esterase